MEYPKAFRKLSKTIRQGEKISQVVLTKILLIFYIVKLQKWIFFDETKTINNAKMTKQSHAYRGWPSTHNVETLKSFNLELQLKDNESTIKNKLNDWLSELRGLKVVRGLQFVVTVVSELKK